MAQRTQLNDSNHPLYEAYACLLTNGLDGAGEALRILVNGASRIGCVQHLQSTLYERCAQRVDYANPPTRRAQLGSDPTGLPPML